MKKCSEEFRKFHKNRPVREFIFVKVVGLTQLYSQITFTLNLFNPFPTNVPLTDKPRSSFLLAKYANNAYGRVTF